MVKGRNAFVREATLLFGSGLLVVLLWGTYETHRLSPYNVMLAIVVSYSCGATFGWLMWQLRFKSRYERTQGRARENQQD